MTEEKIGAIKIRGQIKALCDNIHSRISAITNQSSPHHLFGHYCDGLVFTGLQKKLDRVRDTCDQIEALLVEVRKLDGKST